MTCLNEAAVLCVWGLEAVRLGGRGGLAGKYSKMQINVAIHKPTWKNEYCVIRWLIISTKFCIFSEFDELLMIDSGTLLWTIAGPTTNATEIPKDPAKAEIAVAVVRSLGGNHVAETRGGALRATVPPAMIMNWPTFIKMVRILLSLAGISWRHLPKTDKKAIKSTDILNPKEKKR